MAILCNESFNVKLCCNFWVAVFSFGVDRKHYVVQFFELFLAIHFVSFGLGFVAGYASSIPSALIVAIPQSKILESFFGGPEAREQWVATGPRIGWFRSGGSTHAAWLLLTLFLVLNPIAVVRPNMSTGNNSLRCSEL
jgi:hypothetical protein